MPPKKGAAKAAKAVDKNVKAAKAKAAEDKTFGLKNKNKSNKVRSYVEQVQKQVQVNNGPKTTAPKDKKKAELERQKELNELFAVAIKQPKVPPGVDPKSIVCEYFRAGQCTKGFKCKFSHDLNVERKGAKIDLFTDRRGLEEEGEGMEDWDQEQLEKVVAEKHGKEKPSNETTIICKFFLDAVERKQYGWFWVCPNGKDCKYRHALPPGYVLKSQMKELLELEKANAKSIEETIEEERAKVDAKTPITQETFKAWHQRKTEEKRRSFADTDEERKRRGLLTGREIFMQEGFQAEDDLGAADDWHTREDEEAEMQRIQEEALARNARAAAEMRGGANGGAGPSGYSSEPTGAEAGPSTANGTSAGATKLQLSKEDEQLFLDDDDDDDETDDEDSDEEELDELEAQIKDTSLQ
ncbi:hypothetical protein WJX72_003761 [[Myrmecia] bisecta]|uniref:C3H1-type domain-containing protein n=1 Tax=[Myrmecia] bisecta TaxID=41462 RepID=A0AAW1Q6Z3_9CHLO